MFIFEFPLRIDSAQRFQLDERFFMAHRMRNLFIAETLRRIDLLEKDPRYIQNKEDYISLKKENNQNNKKLFKSLMEDKKSLIKEYNLDGDYFLFKFFSEIAYPDIKKWYV